MLLRTSCVVCDQEDDLLCPACWSLLRPAPAVDPPEGLEHCWSLLLYAGAARELIVALKYRNARAMLGRLGRALGTLVAESEVGAASTIDVVTWAPTSPARVRDRGFDQARLLAHAVARSLDRPCRPLLERGPGLPQTGQRRDDRLAGPEFRTRAGPTAASVLVVDDVRTTGATLRAAAHALRASGVRSVSGATAARTPHEPLPAASVPLPGLTATGAVPSAEIPPATS